MMTIIHCVDSLAHRTGGPARTVTALTDELSLFDDCAIILLSQHRPGETIIAPDPGSQVDRQITVANSFLFQKAAWPLKKKLLQTVRSHPPSLLHYHGIWSPSQYYVASAAQKHIIPLALNTHGMVEPWALQHKKMKKKLALATYVGRALRTVSVFFATAEQEAEAIRGLGFSQPIAVIPNGVTFPPPHKTAARKERGRDGRKIVLFLSRIHPKKGLLNLLDAWNAVRPAAWRLVIAGPDEGGHLAKVHTRIEQLNLDDSVAYVGEQNGPAKSALYDAADLFILPSFSENFGVVVLEALAAGVPVITTHGTPWQQLPQNGCGWWVSPTVDALITVLQEATALSPQQLQEMGRRGASFARGFSWRKIAGETAAVYRWMLGRAPCPDCVLQ